MNRYALALLLTASSASAQNLTVQFTDGAPKDSMTFTNAGCAISDASVLVDLSTSQGGLIFDTTPQGAGVEVYQPVEIISGSVTLDPVTDGDQTLNILVTSLAKGADIRLTADLDDTLDASRQITVSGSEIADGLVIVTLNGTTYQGAFGTDGTASITLPDAICTHS
jgi:hypothetical protein